MGWAFTLFIFQVLHFFFPISAYLPASILIIGIILSRKSVKSVFYLTKLNRPIELRFVAILFGVFFIVIWIALRSMLPTTNYDAGLYYFNTIRWINSFPIIPGLGNLHGRFAYNQSFFTYAAALNFYPYFNHGRSIANSFLFLLTFVTFLNILHPVFVKPSILLVSHPFKFLPSLFALPYLGYLALKSNGLASPSPDLAGILLQLTMFVVLVQGISKWLDGQYYQDQNALLLSVLAATSVTIKLTNLMFASRYFCVRFYLRMAIIQEARPNNVPDPRFRQCNYPGIFNSRLHPFRGSTLSFNYRTYTCRLGNSQKLDYQ